MVVFKSSDNGATITFTVTVTGREEDGIDFLVAVKAPFGTAQTTSSTYFYGSPSLMFKSMAAEWQGWKDEKKWSDLEGSLQLSARSDALGHSILTVELSDINSYFKTVLLFEAGQLEAMADELEALLG